MNTPAQIPEEEEYDDDLFGSGENADLVASLVAVLVKRLGGSVTITVEEVDTLLDHVLQPSVDPESGEFTFDLVPYEALN